MSYIPLLTNSMLAHAKAGLFDDDPCKTRDCTGTIGWVGKCVGCGHRGKLYGGPHICVKC